MTISTATKRWYLRNLTKKFWNCWYRQFLYYCDLNAQSEEHFHRKCQATMLREWRSVLESQRKITALRRGQYFKKWIRIVQTNRIPMLRRPSQIKAVCLWMEHSLDCNVVAIVAAMRRQQNEYNVNTHRERAVSAKQIAVSIQRKHGLVWKSTRIAQLTEMVAIHDAYYGVNVFFKRWRRYSDTVQRIKMRHFRAWQYAMTDWKHRQIVALKYRRRNALRSAFEVILDICFFIEICTECPLIAALNRYGFVGTIRNGDCNISR